jgi:hypothetical protein
LLRIPDFTQAEKMKRLTFYKLYLDEIIQTTQLTSGVGIWISGIESCNHKYGTDKDQVFFLKELRNTNLELVKKIPGSSGIKISQFRNGSFNLVYTRR